MRVDLYVHFASADSVLTRLEALANKLDLTLKTETTLMSDITDALDRAEAAAKANSDADDSAEALLVTLAQLITNLKANTTDPATVTRIDALSAALSDRASKLSAAVVAGTPAA